MEDGKSADSHAPAKERPPLGGHKSAARGLGLAYSDLAMGAASVTHGGRLRCAQGSRMAQSMNRTGHSGTGDLDWSLSGPAARLLMRVSTRCVTTDRREFPGGLPCSQTGAVASGTSWANQRPVPGKAPGEAAPMSQTLGRAASSSDGSDGDRMVSKSHSGAASSSQPSRAKTSACCP